MIRLLVVVAWLSGTGCWIAGGADGGSMEEVGCGDGTRDLITEVCDDGNNESGDGCSASCLGELTITVHWKLEDHTGAPQPCPAGFDTAEVRVARTLTGEGGSMPFRCEAGQATFLAHDLLRSQGGQVGAVRVRITNSTTHELFGETWPTSFPRVNHTADVSVKVITDIGRLHLFWTLSRAGMPTTCEALGVTNVQVDAIPATGPTISMSGPCKSTGFTTGNLPTAAYRIAVSASSASGPGFGARDGVVVPPGEQTKNVEPIDIAF